MFDRLGDVAKNMLGWVNDLKAVIGLSERLSDYMIVLCQGVGREHHVRLNR